MVIESARFEFRRFAVMREPGAKDGFCRGAEQAPGEIVPEQRQYDGQVEMLDGTCFRRLRGLMVEIGGRDQIMTFHGQAPQQPEGFAIAWSPFPRCGQVGGGMIPMAGLQSDPPEQPGRTGILGMRGLEGFDLRERLPRRFLRWVKGEPGVKSGFHRGQPGIEVTGRIGGWEECSSQEQGHGEKRRPEGWHGVPLPPEEAGCKFTRFTPKNPRAHCKVEPQGNPGLARGVMKSFSRLLMIACLLGLVGIIWMPAQTPTPEVTPPPEPSPVPSPDLAREVSTAGERALEVVEKTVENVALQVTRDSVAAQTWSGAVADFFRIQIFGFSLGQLGLSFLILLLVLSIRRLVVQMLFRWLHRWASGGKARFQEQLLGAIEKPVGVFLMVIGVFLAVAVLPIEEGVRGFLTYLFRAATLLTVVWAAVRFTDVVGTLLENSVEGKQDSALAGFVPLIRKTLKAFVLIVGILMAVDNLGYNVTGIIATLGLGTAAVALASQDTLKNGFGALMIMLDRPFKTGDWIQVGDKVDGDVESIGLRSTKVRTWPKTVLSIPNGVLANEYINNWSRMPKRRVKQVVGVTYDATADDMEALVEDIRTLLREDDGVEPAFILVSFTDFGDSSLDILVYYFTQSIAWLEHMDVRQRINCKIMRAIQARGLSVAFPTRTIHLAGQGGGRDSLPGDFGPDTPA